MSSLLFLQIWTLYVFSNKIYKALKWQIWKRELGWILLGGSQLFILGAIYYVAYNSQSIAMIKDTSSMGRSTAVRTIIIVNSPAIGTPAAPILARVAVILKLTELQKLTSYL